MTRFHRLAAVAFSLGCAWSAQASEHEHGERRAAAVPPAYAQECAACHVAFPARGLPAASWQRLMGQLGKHFGTDASLDAKTTAELTQYLVEHAGTGKRAQDKPEQDRMTRTAWFTREHREIGNAVWQRASIGKPSNCAACHAGAPQGRFSEHDVRIPK